MSERGLALPTVRRWSALLAVVLAVTASLLTALAAVEPTVLGFLRRSRGDILVITGFLVVSLLAGSLLLAACFEPEVDTPDAYEPESVPDIPHPGTDVESLTRHPFVSVQPSADRQAEIRDRLRAITVRTIRRHRGVDTTEARDRIERGEWTPNAAAAWFLGETARPPRSVRVYASLSDGFAFQHGARETVRAVVAYERRHTDTEAETP